MNSSLGEEKKLSNSGLVSKYAVWDFNSQYFSPTSQE